MMKKNAPTAATAPYAIVESTAGVLAQGMDEEAVDTEFNLDFDLL